MGQPSCDNEPAVRISRTLRNPEGAPVMTPRLASRRLLVMRDKEISLKLRWLGSHYIELNSTW